MTRLLLLVMIPACLTEVELLDEEELELAVPEANLGVIVDLAPPTTYFRDVPAQHTRSADARFEYTASEPATFRCKLDGAAYAPCDPAGTSYYWLPVGSHTFCVYATDASGNADASPICYAWTIDQTPPQTTITYAPPALTESRTATFTLAASEPATFRCSLDGNPVSCAGATVTLSNLAFGTHMFVAVATDRAGNRDTTPAYHSWRIKIL